MNLAFARKAEILDALKEARIETRLLSERVKIAEARQRHLEVELAQARVSIDTWKQKVRAAHSAARLALTAQELEGMPAEVVAELSDGAQALVGTSSVSMPSSLCVGEQFGKGNV